METPEVQKMLALAFGNLSVFGIPKVGTFRKAFVSAEVDGTQKKIDPPGESFILETGDDAGRALEHFFISFLKLSSDQAKNWVKKISWSMMGELELGNVYGIEEVGELQKVGNAIQFLGRKAQIGNYYGLGGLALELPKSKDQQKEVVVKPEPIKSEVKISPASNTKKAKPIPVVEKVTKKASFLWLVPVILFLGIAGAGYFFWPQIKNVLGLDSSSIAHSHNPEDSAKNKVDTNAIVEANPSVDPNGSKGKASRKKRNPENEVIPREREVAGTKPVVGRHYLVVRSTAVASEAQEFAKELNPGKYNVRVIAPLKSNDYYRVTVFDGESKREVIQKMVSWKGDFPEKSWIYSPN